MHIFGILAVSFLATVGMIRAFHVIGQKLDARAILRQARQERKQAYRQALAEFDRAWNVDNVYRAVNAHTQREPDEWIDNARTTYIPQAR